MTTRTINLREEVYELLKKQQLPGESFEDTILRLCSLASGEKGVAEEFDKLAKKVLEEDEELLDRLAQ